MAAEDPFTPPRGPTATGGRPLGAPEPATPDLPGPTFRDPLAEALRLIGLADEAGLHVRLMGGLAFHVRVPDWTARIERERRDIDLVTVSRDRKALTSLLESSGYVPDRQYNALYGHKQLYFVDTVRQRPVDVILDRLEMCHTFVFTDRLELDHPTIPLAEMLLSKLQIAHINRKDLLDMLALLSDYPLGPDDDRTISLTRITSLTSTDWGWWRTVTGNLDKLRLFLATEVQPGELDFAQSPRYEVGTQIGALRKAVDEAPKSTRWKLRSQVGDRMPWFQEPEEVGHGR
jgi:hypothetical protein